MKRFKAKLGGAAGALFFEVPFDAKKEFGKARAPVKVRVNGHGYRSTISVYGGRYYVPVRKDRRAAAGVQVGDVVDVTLALDVEVREVAVPPDLAASLAKNRRARAAWEKLSYSHRKEHVDAIVQAKRAETRARRVEKTLEMLLES